MNSASKRGNGNIRRCIGFVLVVFICLLALSERAEADANFFGELPKPPTYTGC